MITQANFKHTMSASGSGLAALSIFALHQGMQHSKPQSLRGNSPVANLLRTTESFWACEYDDYRSPGGLSA